MEANDKASETPSVIEIWKVLTEIKTNTEKLVLEVESLKGNYKELKETLQNTKGQVESLFKENKGLKRKVKSLEEQLLESRRRWKSWMKGSTISKPDINSSNILKNST